MKYSTSVLSTTYVQVLNKVNNLSLHIKKLKPWHTVKDFKQIYTKGEINAKIMFSSNFNTTKLARQFACFSSALSTLDADLQIRDATNYQFNKLTQYMYIHL